MLQYNCNINLTTFFSMIHNKVDRMMLIENIESKNWEPALTVDELKELKKKKWLDMHKRNKCSVCAKAFEFNEVYFSEHLKDGSTRYICSNCSKGSKDLDMCANRHRFSHLIPVPKTKLWRYMDLAKFFSVLEMSSLFFTRIDHFKDSYEGRWAFYLMKKPGLMKILR